MINYFSIKNLVLLIIVLILSLFYQYIKDILLKSMNFDPNISTSLNLYSFYLGYTNYNLVKYMISIIGIIIYDLFNIKKFVP